MTWNYRIVSYRDRKQGFGLHEVFYDDKRRPFGMTESAISFTAGPEEGPDPIAKDLRRALRDARKMAVLNEPKKWPGKCP